MPPLPRARSRGMKPWASADGAWQFSISSSVSTAASCGLVRGPAQPGSGVADDEPDVNGPGELNQLPGRRRIRQVGLVRRHRDPVLPGQPGGQLLKPVQPPCRHHEAEAPVGQFFGERVPDA